MTPSLRPLQKAVGSGSLKAVQEALDAGAVNWKVLPEDGQPLIFRALAQGSLPLAQLLHREGADPKQRARQGWDGWDALLGGGQCSQALWEWFWQVGPAPPQRSTPPSVPLLHLIAAHAPWATSWALQAVGAGCRWEQEDVLGRTLWEVLPLEYRQDWEKLTW